MGYTEIAASIVPTDRQVKWNCMEFYGFIHFGLYTFAPDREGKTGAEIFNPEKLDAGQWVRAMKAAGMTGVILTCKHHEGFCLWPSRYTDFSVKNSPWKAGEGDVVKEVAEACRIENIKFGVYLSPWDMREATYGTKEYNRFFLNQLEELLTGYGDIFCVWFDGACRETQKIQEYDWEAYYALIRRLQPEACISICGPDVRWCGNEAGICREEEWSVVPADIMTTERNPGYWRKIDEIPNSTWKDIGSRDFIRAYPELIWYPAEVDVSIRPSWGYIPGEDAKLLTLSKLTEIYESSVGGNATLLLNVPPNPDGLFDGADVERLKELGSELTRIYSKPQGKGAAAWSEDSANGYDVQSVLNANRKEYWRSVETDTELQVVIKLPEERMINLITIKEAIEIGQHIEMFNLDIWNGEDWETVYTGKTIGYKKICRFPAARTKQIRLFISQYRCFAALSEIGLYYDSEKE